MSRRFDPQRFAAMHAKEWRQIRRDPSTLLIAFVLPVVLIFLFGFGVSLDTARTRVGLVLEDGSGPAAGLAAAFQRSPYFDIVQSGDRASMTRALVAGDIRGVIVIPQDFGRQAAGGGGSIQVLTDGASPNTASFVAAYADGIRQTWAAAQAFENGTARVPAVTVNTRFWFNPELKSRHFLVPGAIAIVMTMIGSLLTALVFAREWERGTMEAIMATPLNRFELMATKVLPYFILGLGSMVVCAVLAVAVLGVPFRGSPAGLLAIGAAFLVPALGLGLFISAAAKNQFVASQIALLTAFLPSLLLSGFLFEIDSMPRWVQALTSVVPARYFVPLLQTVFVAGDDWVMFGRGIAQLLGFGALFFAAAIRATRWRIA